jgi:hypothetical protein
MKVKCVMSNEWIDGLLINHSPTPLPKQEQMRALDAKEMVRWKGVQPMQNYNNVLWRNSWWIPVAQLYFSALPKVKHQQRQMVKKSSNAWWEQKSLEAQEDSSWKKDQLPTINLLRRV